MEVATYYMTSFLCEYSRALLERAIEVQTVVVRLHGDLHVFIEEVILALLHGVQQFHVFRAAVDHAAAVRRDETV